MGGIALYGAQKKNGLIVDSNGRAHTEGVVRDQLREAVFKGEAFNFNTGAVTCTNANESGIGYFEYLGDDPFIITEILFIIGATTGGSGDGVAKVYRNPTAFSTSTPIDIAVNRDFSSSITVNGNMYKGATDATITGGELAVESSRSSFGTVIALDAAPWKIAKGNALACSWQPPAGNTSQLVKIAATGYVLGADIVGS